MFIAEELFEASTEFSLEEDCTKAAKLAVKHEDTTIKGVDYKVFGFADGSKFTVGTSGYVGCELPH